MLELARADPDRPYTGRPQPSSAACVRRVRQELAQARATPDVPVRFEGLPAEYLQVDWGEVRAFPFTQQAPATRYFLACRLKYSRWTWVRFTADMRQETLFRGLVDCFVRAGLGALGAGLRQHEDGHQRARRASTSRSGRRRCCSWRPSSASTPRPAAPGAGNQKGSVESLVKWVKGNFLAGRAFADDADLAAQTAAWLAYANTRPSQATDVPPLGAAGARRRPRAGRCRPTAGRLRASLQPGQVAAEALVAVLRQPATRCPSPTSGRR